MRLKGAMLMLISAAMLMLVIQSASAGYANDTIAESIIDDANDTVYLQDRVYMEHDVTIDRSVKIIGSNGTVFDGESQNSLFTIENGAQVTFENIKFANFKRDDSGAVLDIKASASAVIINCTFTGNVMAISNHGNLEIYDSNFYNNSLSAQNSKGGAISNDGKLYIENTVFTDSYGPKNSRGAAIYNNGDLTLNRTTIADSYAGEDSKGSALFNNGICLIVNSTVENNVIERYNFNYMHGAVYNQGNLTAVGNIFRNNTGKYVRPNTWYEGSPTIYNVGNINLSHNAFIDNVYFKGLSTDVFSNGARHISLDENWWQSNQNPIDEGKVNEGNSISNWIVLDLTPQYCSLDINETALIKASWRLNTGGDINVKLFPGFDIVMSDGERTVSSDLFIFNATAKGSYTIEATVCNFTGWAIVDVGKIPVYIHLASVNVTYPQDVTVELESNVNQNVTVNLGNERRIVKITDGKANTTFSGLDAGIYELDVEYEGDDDHARAFSHTTVNVAKMQVALTIGGVRDIKTDEIINAKVILEPNVSPVTAQLYINGEFNKTLYLYDGVNNLTFKNLKEGKYDITVLIGQRENYFAANATASFNVGRYNPRLNVCADDVRLGENATVQISAFNFTGNVMLSINGVNSTVFVKNNTNITVSNLEGGRYNVSVAFNGDSLYLPCMASDVFNVIRNDPQFNVTVNETGSIQVRTSPDCTGRVGVYVNFEVYYMNLTEGRADFTVRFDRGTNYIFAFYDGDRLYENATFNETIILGSEFLIVSEDVEAYEYNDFAYSVILVEENRITMPNRQVSIAFNGRIYNVTTDSSGVASITLNLPAGEYVISAGYLNRTATNSITVRPISFEVAANDVSYGETQRVMAAFNGNVTGNVTFQIGDSNTTVEVNGSQATVNLSGLKIGRYDIRATYFNGFIEKSADSSFNVVRATPKVNVRTSNILPGEDEIIEVTFEEDIIGEVKISVDKDYTVEINNSKAILKLSNLERGIYDVIVTYGGSENYTNCTLKASFAVRDEASELILDVNNTCFGQDIAVSAILNLTATGNVTFTVASISKTVQIINGEAKCTFACLEGGTYRVDAEYAGDMTFAPKDAYTFFRVLKANATLSIVTDEIALGENILIYAYLPSNATGEVFFSMTGYYSPRARQIEDGMAFWYISPLEAGRYTIVATYAGDANYNPANATFTLKVSQIKSILSVAINDATANDRIIANVELKDVEGTPISGRVNLTLDGNVYPVNVKEGSGRLVIGRMNPGNYMFSAVYGGDNDYSTSSVAGSFKVAENLLESSISANNITAYYKGEQTLEVTLTSNGKPISQASVIVSISGRRYELTTDNRGRASLELDLASGKYVAEIEFDETLSHEASSATSHITVLSTVNASDVVKLYGSGTQYFAMFFKSDGKALGNAEVSFNLNGKTYKVKTLPNGVVRLNININPGTYKITAVNPETGEKAVNTVRIYAKIMANRDLTQYYGANKLFKVQIFNATTGNPVKAGETVKFKINKKTYTAKTDKNGYAALKITLKPGKYTITTMYGGYKVSNRITVKPVLTAKNIVGKNVNKVKFKAKLVSKNGKALKGKKITFKFKGKTYKVKTNKKGIAALTLKNLKAGKYKIKSIYGKSKITNTIRIR